MHSLALITEILANFAHDIGKLLDIVLHEVDLRVIVLLHSVQSVPVFVPYLLHVCVHHPDVVFVLLLCLFDSKITLPQFLLERGSYQS